MAEKLPRMMFVAPNSGAGKTTVVCAVLQALVNRKLKVSSFKCGPDYIDPMFHSKIIGIPSRNLDLFLLTPSTVRFLLHKNSIGTEIAVLEGAMGYYDGIGTETVASSYELSKETQTPCIFIINGKGMSKSISAIINGFLTFRPDHQIKAVLFNRISASAYLLLKKIVETDLHLPVLGYLPELLECGFESRHLGLVTADEVENLKYKMKALAAQAEETVDLDALICLAASAPELEFPKLKFLKEQIGEPLKIAIARDESFCFYYEDSCDLLRELGAELVSFSPLRDSVLPKDICGLLLGGGYPELYAEELSNNQTMRQSIHIAIKCGMPCIAECGGFLYLHKTLEDQNGISFPMVDVISAEAVKTNKLGRFGYMTLNAEKDNLLCKKGKSFPVHEFHYWNSLLCGDGFLAEKPSRKESWKCGHSTETLYASFPHFHFYSQPEMAVRFLKKCTEYQGSGKK